MNENWINCHKCKYWFSPDNVKKNYKVVQYNGAIIGAICTDCSGFIQEEKTIQ